MSELTLVKETPRWVSELASPPPFRSKASSIPDPPGYPSQAPTSSKVRRTYACLYSANTKTNMTLACRKRTHRKTPNLRENSPRQKRWIP